MAIIRVSCSNCHYDAELPSAFVAIVEYAYMPRRLHARADQQMAHTIISTYQYECPACHEFIIHDAEPHVVLALQTGNCKLRRVYVAAPSNWHVSGEISYDDVINFHEALENVITIDDLTTM